mgnify:CR=1 FL=1
MHIQDCLEEILHLEDTDLAASLADASRLFSCKKRQLVAKPDACSDWIPFLVSGVIRGYLTDEKGRDITDCFLYRPGEAVLSLSILTASFPINFEAVTDCVLLSIPTQLLAEQFQQSAELQQLYSSYLLEKLKLERELKLLLGISSAMERYQWFLRRYPELADVVSIKHIASFFMYVPSVSEPPARAAAQARRGASGQAEPTLRKERALLMSAARIWAAQLVEDVLPRSPAEQRELLEYGPAANGKKAIPGTE